MNNSKIIFMLFKVLLVIGLFASTSVLGQLRLQEPDSSFIEHLPDVEILYLECDTALSEYKFVREPGVQYMVMYRTFDYVNDTYWKYQEGKLADSIFRKIVDIYKISDIDFYKIRKLRCRLSLLLVINSSNKKLIRIDTDNDGDFTDERAYSETEFGENTYVRVSNIEIYDSGSILINSVFVSGAAGFVDTSGYNDFQKKWAFALKMKAYKNATYRIDENNVVNIVVPMRSYSRLSFGGSKARVYIIESPKTSFELVPYSIHDTVIVGGSKVRFDSIDSRNSELAYTLLSQNEQIKLGHNVADVMYNVDLNFNDGTSQKLANVKKYIVFDFWGSWCGPCKTIYPMIDSLRKLVSESAMKDSVLFVNVALESESTIAEYRELMKVKYLSWRSILLENSDATSLISKLHIQAYPTLILVDVNGTILARVRGVLQFSQFKEALKQHLLGKHINRK
jgi:thiol-disulfide isomerase/thioredoxin